MDGFLNINKPKGFTSHDVVDYIRKRFRPSRVGHLGTLDPMARGVLPLAIGKATKLTEYLIKADKEYEGYFLLGIQTDTQDIEGKVLSLNSITSLDKEMLKKITDKFHGERQQLTPMFSARWHKGKRLFDLARQGQEVKRSAKKINVYRFEVVLDNLPRLRFFIHCSKGTYIRTVAHDMGEEIGCGACLLDLVRLRKGPFEFSQSVSLSELNSISSFRKHLIPEEDILNKF